MTRFVASRKITSRGLFVKGPLDWKWLCAASQVQGKGLHVAVVLYLLMGLRKSTTVKLGRVHLGELGVSRYSAYRALKALENEGLVTVARQRGAAPVVSLRPIDGANQKKTGDA